MRSRRNHPIAVLSRLRGGRKTGIAVGGGMFGILTSAAGLAGLAGMPELLGIGGAAVLVGAGVAYVRGAGQILPRNLIDQARNQEAPYSCEYCTETSLAQACELSKSHYKDEYVRGEQAETWRQKNPKAFVHLMNRDADLAASFGVLALSASFTEQFLKGNVTDLLLKADDVLDVDASKKSPALYISGVVVRDPDTHLGRKRAAAMLWVMVQYCEKLYGVRRKRMLYAIAVTQASEVLMKNLGFVLTCQATKRQDGYPLYCYDLTSDSWKQLKARVGAFGDSSTVCTCAF